MATLNHDLPDHLYWLTDRVMSLVRPAAFLKPVERHRRTGVPVEIAALGSTILSGEPDIPTDAPWAAGAGLPRNWLQHCRDGESFVAQINLAEIPAAAVAHLPALPRVGVVWVVIDCGHSWRWTGKAHFDPRAADEIPWQPRRHQKIGDEPAATKIVLHDTLTCATDETLPEVASDRRDLGLCCDYDDWWLTHYATRRLGRQQVGGWIHPIQGDCDTARKTLVASFGDQAFGDAGEVYLHYSVEREFFVTLEAH